ncbi:MAG: hypothetical protein ACI9J5_001740 [Paraglaciecola sp.]|jgi:hypothetical protein
MRCSGSLNNKGNERFPNSMKIQQFDNLQEEKSVNSMFIATTAEKWLIFVDNKQLS